MTPLYTALYTDKELEAFYEVRDYFKDHPETISQVAKITGYVIAFNVLQNAVDNVLWANVDAEYISDILRNRWTPVVGRQFVHVGEDKERDTTFVEALRVATEKVDTVVKNHIRREAWDHITYILRNSHYNTSRNQELAELMFMEVCEYINQESVG